MIHWTIIYIFFTAFFLAFIAWTAENHEKLLLNFFQTRNNASVINLEALFCRSSASVVGLDFFYDVGIILV